MTYAVITATIVNSCTASKYRHYHADWRVIEFESPSVDYSNSLLVYNFNIDINKMRANPAKISQLDLPNIKWKTVPIKLFTEDKIDYIEFTNHPFLTEKYEIFCTKKTVVK